MSTGIYNKTVDKLPIKVVHLLDSLGITPDHIVFKRTTPVIDSAVVVIFADI